MFGNEASVGILIHWILLGLVIAYLPTITRAAKLDDAIDTHMISVIRAVLTAYFIVSIVGIVAGFIARFFG